MLVEKYRLNLRKIYIKFTADLRRLLLTQKDFTIISNNCWAGTIYQSFGLQYRTPTIGLYFMASDYIDFLSDLKYYASLPLKFIAPEKSKYWEIIKNDKNIGKYPIKKLDNVEIFFLHYKDENEARIKWEKRCKRIDYSELLVKFNDQNLCNVSHLVAFEGLPFKNKICFTVKNYENLKSTIYIRCPKKYTEIPASYEPFGNSHYINITNFLNSIGKD